MNTTTYSANPPINEREYDAYPYLLEGIRRSFDEEVGVSEYNLDRWD